MDKIMLSRECSNYIEGGKCSTINSPDCPNEANTDCTITRPMTAAEQRVHHKHIIARANQSVTAKDGFVDNSLFFKTVVQEAHTFTDKHGVVWAVS